MRVAQLARLGRASGRVGLRVEVDDQLLTLEVPELHFLAVLVEQREVRGLVTDRERHVVLHPAPRVRRTGRSMPHVRRRMLVRLDEPPATVAPAARAALDLRETTGGTLTAALPGAAADGAL